MTKDEEVMRLKPDMELVPSPASPDWSESTAVKFVGKTTAQAKADGEFELLVYNKRGETFTKNKYGRKETPETLPALEGFVKVMRKQPIKKAKFLVEMHVFHEKLLRVAKFIHYLKGKDHGMCKGKPCEGLTPEQARGFIRLGFFRMISVDGREIRESIDWQFEEMASLLAPAHPSLGLLVLPWMEVKSKKDIEKAWRSFVDKTGYEGLVVRNGVGTTYKLKPELELDAVIVALNKNDGYSKRRGTSLRLALMIDEETFVEIGDVASGITHDLRAQLWKMKDMFGLDETGKMHYVQPIAVVCVRFNDFWQKQMPCWKFDGSRRIECGTRASITMRHPKLITFRTDKTACVKDIGLLQIPRGVYENENYGDE